MSSDPAVPSRAQRAAADRPRSVPASPSGSLSDPDRASHPSLNLVLLQGALSGLPTVTELPSGSILVGLSVATVIDDGSTTSVPVAMVDPPRAVQELASGDLVVVTGRVRRRFFRSGGGTASRTEVVASRVVPARQSVRARTAVERWIKEAQDHLEGSGG